MRNYHRDGSTVQANRFLAKNNKGDGKMKVTESRVSLSVDNLAIKGNVQVAISFLL